MRQVVTTPSFDRVVKKLSAKDKQALDQAVRKVFSAPEQGPMKKGDFAGVRVFKFLNATKQQVLGWSE